MSAKNAQTIEEYAGIPPDELDDNDLKEAMQELGIPDEDVSAEDHEA